MKLERLQLDWDDEGDAKYIVYFNIDNVNYRTLTDNIFNQRGRITFIPLDEMGSYFTGTSNQFYTNVDYKLISSIINTHGFDNIWFKVSKIFGVHEVDPEVYHEMVIENWDEDVFYDMIHSKEIFISLEPGQVKNIERFEY